MVAGVLTVISAAIGRVLELSVAVPLGVVAFAFSLAVIVNVGVAGPGRPMAGLPQV
jgi:hypothetical protein